jgi:cytoskeletal protein RodZ
VLLLPKLLATLVVVVVVLVEAGATIVAAIVTIFQSNCNIPKNPKTHTQTLKNPLSTTSKDSKFASSHPKKNIPNLFTLTLHLHHHHHNLFFLFFFLFFFLVFCFLVFFFFPLQIHPNPRPNPQPLLPQIPNIRETNAKKNLPQIQPNPRPNSQPPTSVATAAIFASHYVSQTQDLILHLPQSPTSVQLQIFASHSAKPKT